jgi:mRNA interferase RelE/StbE
MAGRHRLRVPDPLAVLLRALHPGLKRKVRAALDLVREDPDSGKALRHDLGGLHSFRVGRLRIIYRVAPKGLIELVAFGPRSTIYAETLRLVRRERETDETPC